MQDFRFDVLFRKPESLWAQIIFAANIRKREYTSIWERVRTIAFVRIWNIFGEPIAVKKHKITCFKQARQVKLADSLGTIIILKWVSWNRKKPGQFLCFELHCK